MNSSMSIGAALIAPQHMEMKMRKLTFGAVVLATTLLATGAVRAADEPSREAADTAAEAAASSGHQGLAYAASQARSSAFARIRQDNGPALSQGDQLFLQQGDRGIGNN